MNKDREEKLAQSLTAESVDLLPFLPYLLQDLWELGSSPEDMIAMIERHLPHDRQLKILDLGCGKGAVGVKIAKTFGCKVTGYDLIPDFIEYAEKKAHEHEVQNLCRFIHDDIHRVVQFEENYDCVILGAVGEVLGKMPQTLTKLKNTVRPQGFILIDDGYIITDNSKLKFPKYEYYSYDELKNLFLQAGLNLLEEIINQNNNNNDSNNEAIQRRANELIQQYPDKKDLIMSYVQSQLNECEDLENHVVGATFLLQKLY